MRRPGQVLALLILATVAALLLLQRHLERKSASGLSMSDRGEATDAHRGSGRTGEGSLSPARGDGGIVARGVVRDAARRRGLPGAPIAVTRQGLPVVATTADPDGAFEVECAEGDVVESIPPGYFRAKAACAERVELHAMPAIGFEGRVVRNGVGVANARVTCDQPSTRLAWQEWGVYTGSTGEFAINCGPSETMLTAAAPEGAPVSQDLGAQSPGSVRRDVVLELGAGRRIRGTVEDSDGRPAVVQLLAVDRSDVTKTQYADVDGRFELGAGIGAYSILVVASDGRCARSEVPAGSVDVALALSLPAGNIIKGRVIGPPTEVSITYSRAKGEGGAEDAAALRDRAGLHSWRKARVAGGVFTLTGLEPGEYSISAFAASWSGKAAVVVPTDEEVVITLEQKPTLVLEIHRDGTPQTGSLSVQHEGKGGIYTSIKDGRAVIRDIKAGDTVIGFRPWHGAVPTPTSVAIRDGENHLAWELRGAAITIEGVVRDATTGSPVVDAQVSPARASTRIWIRELYPQSLTDAEGRFTYLVESRDVPLFIDKEGYESKVLQAADAASVQLTPGISKPSVTRE